MELDIFDWKVCTSCLIKKKTEEFGKNKSQRDGLHYYCKKCVKGQIKEEHFKIQGVSKAMERKK